MAIDSDTRTVDRPASLPLRWNGDPPLRETTPPAQPSADACRRDGQSDVASALTEHFTTDSGARLAADVHATLERRRRRSRLARVTYRTADAAMLLAASVTAILAAPVPHSFANFAWGIAYAGLTLVILEARGFYGFRLQDTPVDAVARIFAATSIAAMTLTFARALRSDDPTLTAQTVRLWAFALVFLGAGRVGITLDRRRALRRGETGFNTLIIGAGSVGHLIARRLRERPEFGLRPIGFLDKDPLIEEDDEDGLRVLGASWDLEQVVQRYDVEQVVVTFSTAPHAVLLGMIRRCRELGVEVVVVPRLFEEVSNRVEVEHLGGVPLLRAATVDPRGWQFGIKYAIDRIVAAFAIVALSPVLIALALAVRLSSPGPIFFRQRRIGLDGREFDMLKFRSMREAPASAEGEFVLPEGVAPGRRRGRGPPHARRRDHAPPVARRAAAAAQHPARRHGDRRAASGAHELRALVRGARLPLRRPPPREVRPHRLGAGARPARPDVPHRPRRVGQLLHRELVALARPQDHLDDGPGAARAPRRRVAGAAARRMRGVKVDRAPSVEAGSRALRSSAGSGQALPQRMTEAA